MSGRGIGGATGEEDRGPAVRVPPPVLVAGTLLLAWLGRKLLPLPFLPSLTWVGGIVALAGLSLGLWAIWTMIAAGTTPRPDRPNRALVVQGPFRFSRNPIYLGFLLVAAGAALAWGGLWGWLAVAASWWLLRQAVIAPEEDYLGRRFGAEYEAYRQRVRRWV